MFALLIVAAALTASLGTAAPLAVTEPPDHPGTAGTTYTVDTGTNTISGFVNGSPFSGDFQDNFSILVPGNLIVTGTSVSITNFNNGGGAAGLGCFTGAGCFGAGGFFGLNNPAPGSTTSYTADSPWANAVGGGVNLGSFNFTLTLQVAEANQTVPEPGTFALIVPVLAGAWLLRRRG
jgi:uncharacterized protein (TIGR03382 family)